MSEQLTAEDTAIRRNLWTFGTETVRSYRLAADADAAVMRRAANWVRGSAFARDALAFTGLPSKRAEYTIRTFNTGRKYQADGQKIAYAVLSTGNVAMADDSRMIDRVLLRTRPELPLTDAVVLALYDNNRTAPYDEAECSEARALFPALYRAAREQ